MVRTSAHSAIGSGIFPHRTRILELSEVSKKVSWKKIPKTIDDLTDSRTVRNEELPVTLESEAFDIGFSEPDYYTTRRLNVF